MIEGKNENHCNTCPTSIRGMCCWFSFYDRTDNFIIFPCKYLSKKTRRCTIYKNRFKINDKCLKVSDALKQGAFPKECAYVKESDIKPVIPNKIYNKEKRIEMIKDGLEKRRFHTNSGTRRKEGIWA